MKTTTAEQLHLINRILLDKKMTVEQAQKLVDGFFSDLCDIVKCGGMSRDEFRKLCGLKSAQEIFGIVKLISGAESLDLDETDGKETFVKGKVLFLGGFDSDFENHGTNVPSSATGKIKVSVGEIFRNGTFAQIFGGMSDDLNSLCLTQDQIIQFVKKYSKWLRTDGYATFFLFKVKNEFFVALVDFCSGGQLEACVGRFSYGSIWRAGCLRRVVVPQLMTIKNQS